jgi:hypothetical protein
MSSAQPHRTSPVVLLVFAAAALGFGLYLGASAPHCGGKEMHPGDTCYSYKHGTSTYEEELAKNRSAPLWGGLVAVVFVAWAIGVWIKEADRTARPATPVAAGGPGRPAAPSAAAPRPAGSSARATSTVSSVTALPYARTPREAHLAMSMSPCPCGAADIPTTGAFFVIDGVSVRRYSGTCTSCGRPREFLYRLPDMPLVAPPGQVRFGDGAPSELLDPGVWLGVADHYARLSPFDASGLDAAGRRAARHNVATAVAAMDEVLAFLPPGAAAVPASAFFSPTGRAIRDREPGRFGRARLEAVRDTYREIVAELDGRPSR